MPLNESQILQLLQQLVQWQNDVGQNSKTTEELPALSPFDRTALLRYSKGGTSFQSSVQDLINDISSEFALSNVPAKFRSVIIDFEAAGTTQSKVITAINAFPNYLIEQGTLYFFYTNRIVLTNGEGAIIGPGGVEYAVVNEFFVLTKKIPEAGGTYSIGVGGTTLVAADIRYFNTIDTRSFAPTTFDLGDIGAANIWDAVDTSGPYSTPNGATILFEAIQSSVAKLWLYVGAAEQVGLGEPVTTTTDYRLFPNEDDTDPEPTYQETTPQNQSDVSPATIKLDNHEGRYFFITTPNSSINDFTTSDHKLGGKAFMALDSTGRTAFPTFNTGTAVIVNGDKFIVNELYIAEVWWDGQDVNVRFTIVGQQDDPDIEEDDQYPTMAAMIADQNNQIDGDILRVDDASGHPDIGSGYAYFDYLGTIVGDETDYNIISTEVSGGEWTYIGTYNVATNTPDLDVSPSGITKGDCYEVTGTGFFFTTEQLDAGDVLIAKQDNPTALGHWLKINKNIDDGEVLLRDGSVSMAGAFNERQGANIALIAGTADIGAATGNYIVVTGSGNIDNLGSSVTGCSRTVRFNGSSMTLKHTSAIYIPSEADIAVADKDVAIFRNVGGANWVCAAYTKVDGTAIIGLDFSGFAKISVGTSAPGSPATNDLWVDTN